MVGILGLEDRSVPRLFPDPARQQRHSVYNRHIPVGRGFQIAPFLVIIPQFRGGYRAQSRALAINLAGRPFYMIAVRGWVDSQPKKPQLPSCHAGSYPVLTTCRGRHGSIYTFLPSPHQLQKNFEPLLLSKRRLFSVHGSISG